MSWRFYVHFSRLPMVQRVLYTGTLSVLTVGYLFAMIHIFSSHAGRDGDPMLSVDDIIIAYSGSKNGTVLESALVGPMSRMLSPEENMVIVGWIRSGVNEKKYNTEIKSVLDKRCITCHNKRNPHLPSLESYQDVLHVTEQDTGMDIFSLIRVSHIHLFGLTFIFFLIGMVFRHAYMRQEWLKITLVAIPFIAIICDIASWYVTKVYQPFAWIVIISGGLMGLSFALQVFISLYQIWFFKPPAEARPQGLCETD